MAETIKGLNIKIGLDATELNESLGKVRAELKEQQADLKAINQRLKYDPSNVELWKNKQTKLNEVLDSTKRKLELQKQKLEEAKEAVKVGAISESEFKKLERAIEYAEADVSKLNTELKNTSTKILELGNAKWDKLAGVGNKLTKYVTAPIVAAGTALSALSYKSLVVSDDLADTASKVYLSAEAFQEWSYAAEILAVDQNQLQKAFVKVNALLGDIANGSADSVNEKLKLIGLTSEDLAGLNTDEAFMKIRDALSSVGDEASRTAVANEIFGDKLGAELTQVISASTSQVKDLRNECRKLGIVSNEDAEKAGEFTDAISRLKQALTGLQNELAQALLPVMNSLVLMITNKIVPALKNTLDWWNNLSKGMKVFIGTLLGIVTAAGPVLAIIGKLIPLISKIKVGLTTLKGAITIAGGAIKASTLGIVGLVAVLAVILLQNEKFRELLGNIINIISKLLNKVMDFIQETVNSLMPIIKTIMDLINKVIDMLVEVIDKILPPLESIINVVIGLLEKLMPLIKRILEVITSLIGKVVDLITTILEPIMEVLGVVIDLIADLVDAILELINAVLDPIMDVLNVLVDIIEVVVSLVGDVVKILGSILKPILKVIITLLEPIIKVLKIVIELVSSIIKLLEPLIKVLLTPLELQLQLISSVLSAFEPILETIGNVIETVISPALELLNTLLKPILNILSWIIDAIKWLADNLSNIFEGISDGVSNFAGGIVDKVSGVVGSITEKFSGMFGWLKDKFKGFTGFLGEVGENIGNFFKGAVDGVKGAIGKATDAVSGWAKKAWGNVKGWFSSVGDWFSDTFNLNGNKTSNYSTTNNNQTTNNVTVNTSSSEFDVDSINKALGGAYL
jgi:phage-related protein